MKRRIYLASSWRNPFQPEALRLLRSAGHDVYDFRNPAPGEYGFSWAEIDRGWKDWKPEQFITSLTLPIAQHCYSFDKRGLDWADACVLLLPCGKSAHLEAGYSIGKGKPTLVVLMGSAEPELMYLLAGSAACIVPDLTNMLDGLALLPRVLESGARS